MQIFALSRLAKSPDDVFMCGDVSQIINPTFFKLGRIGVLFKNKFRIDLNKNNTLNENYRNSETIVEIARELLDIRQQTLGVYSEDIKEESKEIERQSGLPFFLDTDVETIIPVLGTWLGIPRVAIIVASEETKKFLKKRLRIKGQTNIYTVQEVKGQEFDKIITFNIISEFKNEWEEILSGKIEKGSDLVNRYRYYYNILYVAITRGRVNLFIFEKDKDLEIINRILHLFEVLQDNFEGVMNLAEYDTEENRRIQAEEYFKSEDYDRARTYYLQLNDSRSANICKGHSYIQKGKYLEGVAILYQDQKYHQKIFDYTKGNELLLYRLIIGYKTNLLSMAELDMMVGSKSLIKLLRDFKEKMSGRIKITKTYERRLLDDIMDLMTEVYRYRVRSKINIIGSGEYYGKI